MKVKLFALGLVIFTSILLCSMSALDAPEYVRCGHIGICEFLEVCGNLGNNLGDSYILYASTISTAMDQPLKDLIHNLIHRNQAGIQNTTLSMTISMALMSVNQPLKDLIHSLIHRNETGIRSFPWPDMAKDAHFIIRFINSAQKIFLLLPPRVDDIALIKPSKRRIAHPSGVNSLPSETLRFITTSIIRS
ncbi:MAG: hypothetical protein AB1798_22845 [Spirochaetota bacterium]